jgi:CRISPR/Cas system-associated exonuclease Cas4 (RecB family)
VYVPKEYNSIIDGILGEIDHNFKNVKFAGLVNDTRLILPSEKFTIPASNPAFCANCEFNLICDSTKNKNNKI